MMEKRFMMVLHPLKHQNITKTITKTSQKQSPKHHKNNHAHLFIFVNNSDTFTFKYKSTVLLLTSFINLFNLRGNQMLPGSKSSCLEHPDGFRPI